MKAGRHGSEGRKENVSGNHPLPRRFSGFLSALVCFMRTEQDGEQDSSRSSLKSSTPPQSSHHPRAPTHTHTRSPLHPWHVGPAVERVIVTPCPMLERTHGPNCPCHRPDSGCEILDLTSSALMKEHGGTGTGGGAEDTPRWGGKGVWWWWWWG